MGPEWIVVAVVAVVVIFGVNKLPQIARNVGKAQSEFKKGLKEGGAADDTVEQQASAPPSAAPPAAEPPAPQPAPEQQQAAPSDPQQPPADPQS